MKNANKLVTLPLLSLIAIPSAAKTVTPPNVVLILIDDMGWTDLGVYGSEFYQTPQVDSFANDAIRFTNGYAACTVSSPTRASILTGKYPAKLKLTDWIKGYDYPDTKLIGPDWKMYLEQEETTIAEVFKAEGYTTAHIGKWHQGEDEKYWPEFQGFDINIGGWKKGSPNLNKSKDTKGPKGYFSPYGNPRLEDGPEGEYLTERLADEACEFIQKQTTPFFLNLWFYNVHTPLMARQEKIDKYMALVDSASLQRNPVYAAMVEHVDDAVGKVIQQLKQQGIYDNTIIVFTSDNGGLIGRGDRTITSNAPLRQGKGHYYEGGVRVPFMIKNLNQDGGGTVNDTPVMSIDLLPTIADLSGISIDPVLAKTMDGISISNLLNSENNQLKRNSLFWHYPHYHPGGATPYSAVRNGDWKLIHILETDSYELYNLKNDIGELNNQLDDNPQLAARLKKELEEWRVKMGAQMPVAR